jgi:hypothetical protein
VFSSLFFWFSWKIHEFSQQYQQQCRREKRKEEFLLTINQSAWRWFQTIAQMGKILIQMDDFECWAYKKLKKIFFISHKIFIFLFQIVNRFFFWNVSCLHIFEIENWILERQKNILKNRGEKNQISFLI